MAYCTTADVKEYITTTEGDHDTLIGNLITRAQAWIDRYVGFSFEASADTTRKYDTYADTDGDTLYFDTWFYSITTVTNGDSTVITSSYYVTEPRNSAPYYAIRLKSSSGYVWETDSNNDHENAISITGKAAFSATAPADIKHVCIRLTVWMYHQRTDQTGTDRVIFQEGTMIAPANVPKDILAILDAYRWRTR